MKLKYKILTLVMFLFAANLFSQEKVYVFFDDIDKMYREDGVPYTDDSFTQAYFIPLTAKNNFFTPNLLKTGYSAFFNSGKSLTNYEVAVFYMGDKALQDDAGSGRRIVTQIKGMLDIGKRVILIGNRLLYLAFDPSSNQRDNEVQQFFADYLGIDQNAYLGLIQTSTGSGGSWTPKAFGIKAFNGDEVTRGYPKICNIGASENNVPVLQPWRKRPAIEAIDGSRLPATTIPCEFFTWETNQTNIYTTEPTNQIVGVRVQKPSSTLGQDSKIMFWSTGFEVAAASTYIPNFQDELWWAMLWCTNDLPQPGPHIEFNVDPLEFGTVADSDSLTKEVKISNTGKDPLEIYDMFLEDPYSGFKVKTTELEHTLEPGEFVYIPVQFKPQAEGEHQDNFTVVSNAFEGEQISIGVNGYGGKKPEPGPRLAVVSNVLDFGMVGNFDIDTLAIEMTNPGIHPLFISKKFYWPNVEIGNNPFQYAQNYTWPITIEPGDTARCLIKFVPLGKVGTLEDKIGIIPDNAVNYIDDTLWVTLKAVSRASSTEASISVDTEELITDSTIIGEEAYKYFTIENTGTKTLNIIRLELANDYNKVFKIVKDFDDTPFNEVTQLSAVKGANKRKVYVKFKPTEFIEYSTKLFIEFEEEETSNALPELSKEITIIGQVKDTSTIEVVEGISRNGLISVKAVPNPVLETSTLFFTVNSDSEIMLELYLVDMLGNKVREFKTGRVAYGDYSLPFKTADLPSGMYYIVGTANGDMVRLPVSVIK